MVGAGPGFGLYILVISERPSEASFQFLVLGLRLRDARLVSVVRVRCGFLRRVRWVGLFQVCELVSEESLDVRVEPSVSHGLSDPDAQPELPSGGEKHHN